MTADSLKTGLESSTARSVAVCAATLLLCIRIALNQNLGRFKAISQKGRSVAEIRAGRFPINPRCLLAR